VALCVVDIRCLVLADWKRAVPRVLEMRGTHRSWFSGREPTLTLSELEVFWCPASAIAHVTPA
jgi:hypothetical protein